MKKLSYLFTALAIVLSDIMCFVVAYHYRDMLCGIEHSCYSAPASVAFLYAVPFSVGMEGPQIGLTKTYAFFLMGWRITVFHRSGATFLASDR